MSEYQNKAPNKCLMGSVLLKRIDKIIRLIPDEFPLRENVVGMLTVPRELIRTTHPAAMQNRWVEVRQILEREFPPPRSTVLAKKIALIISRPVNLTPRSQESVD